MSIMSTVEKLIPEAVKYFLRDRTFQACLTAGAILVSPGLLDWFLYMTSGHDFTPDTSTVVDLPGVLGGGLIVFAAWYRLRINSKAATEKQAELQRKLLASIPRNDGVLQHDAEEAFGAVAPADAIAALLKHTKERKTLLRQLGRGGAHLQWNGTWFQGRNRYLKLEKRFYWGAVVLHLILFLLSLAATVLGTIQYILAKTPLWAPAMWGGLSVLSLIGTGLFLRDVAGIYAAEKIIDKGPAPIRPRRADRS